MRPWFNLPLIQKGMTVIIIPLFSILLSLVALYIFQQQRQDLGQWITRAFQAGARIQGIVTLLVNADNGSRGFLLTRQPDYLEPLNNAELQLTGRLNTLRLTVPDSASQLRRVDKVDVLSRQTLETLRLIVSQPEAPEVPSRINQVSSLLASINGEFTAMRTEESDLWTARVATQTKRRNQLSMGMYAAGILALLTGVIAMALFVTGIVTRLKVIQGNAEHLVRREPLIDPPAGEDEIGQVGKALARSAVLLSEHEAKLRKLNEDLNLLVQERTRQLETEMSERQRSEEQLRQAQKMEAVGRLAGGIAHDFNNILTVIMGYGQMLYEHVPADPGARLGLTELLKAADHAGSLTRQLLAFSRRHVIQLKPVDLNAVLTSVEKMVSRLIGEHIVLQVLPGAGLNKIRADEGQLEQVILNMVLNARDAMPSGGKLTIETSDVDLDDAFCRRHLSCAPGPHVMLSVSDSGHGMTPEVQSHIFEPFFTTKGNAKGTGLGLPTIYGIVKHSGGTIWVDSEVGVGTTFKVYFPALAAADEVAPAALLPQQEAKENGAILLVEDEPAVRMVTREMLLQQGYTVLEADGAEAARRLCRDRASIDLLLTDVIMPHTNGSVLARELRNEWPRLKVLFMSGYTDDAITQHGVLEPGVDFIEKPFTPERLSAKIREVLQKRFGAQSA